MKVMIVDADSELSHLLKLTLQVGFYEKAKTLAREGNPLTESLEVEHFASQKNALRYLEQTSDPVDLIFTEIDATKTDGYAFLEACQQYRVKYGDIVILSERKNPHDVQRGILAGARDYIIKPFEPQDVMKHVFQAWERMAGPGTREKENEGG